MSEFYDQALEAYLKGAGIPVTDRATADDNPEHIHLLTKDILTDLFNAAGCRQLHFGGVPNHLFMVATCKAC